MMGVSTKIRLGETVYPVTVFIPRETQEIDGELVKKKMHPVEALCDEKIGEGLKQWALPCFSRVFVYGEVFDDIESDSGSDSEPAEEDEIQSFSDDSDVIEEPEPKRRRV